ncbi:MAG: hypothetical protein COV45_07180 [Deltaproteobacteria bacterium CG11_big_fil_rev_8_21_14_0_20_47_16]|nr:MAG: hypothetical protein COV45_07180 [Deltaproteobacteria bacterium CG11_big_fil_rev_8_21_14_0_20_47_16]
MVRKTDDDIDDEELEEEDLEEVDDEDFDDDVEEDDDADSDEETEVEDDDDVEEEEEVEEVEMDAAEDHISEETSPDYDNNMAGLAADVPVQVVAVLGKRSFSMQDLMKFHVGQVVDLYRPANETVDLVVGGKLVAKGELVSIDGKLGVKIIKLI